MPSSKSIKFSSALKGVILAKQAEQSLNGNVDPTPDADDLSIEADELGRAADEAYHRGLEEGKAAMAAEMQARAGEMEKQLEKVMASMVEERNALAVSLQELLPELVVEGVGRILHGLTPDREMMRAIIADILEDFDPEDNKMQLSMHPSDLALMIDPDGRFCEARPGLQLVANDKLHRGECMLDSRFGVTDARFSAKLASLRKVLE
ncbi:MAG: FliH/SctL family protein [Puniceicoccaceae bacterium]